MYLIVGLGNPGKKYDNTRHNCGFDVIDKLAKEYCVSVGEEQCRAKIGKGFIEGQKVIFAKPQTFMNLSGESIRGLLDYYKIDETSNLIVISDDINLPVGDLRIREKGSAGGHNGLKNIISHLGHSDFIRIRVGVGEKPKEYELVDYVLGHFSSEDRKLMEEAYTLAASAVKLIVTEGAAAAANRCNGRKKKEEKDNAGTTGTP